MTRHSRFLAAALIASLALGGCASGNFGTALSNAGTILTGGTVADVAPVTLGDAEKVLTISHNTVNYVGVQLIYNSPPPLGVTGLLHGRDATTAKGIFDKAVGILDIGDKADAVANTQGILSAVGDVQDLVSQFNALKVTDSLVAPPGITPPPTH